ncbi:MAG: hypothetical protein JXQ66_00200 [Campylobacterales bacterium]|nr:hypothetical protein [Campylobacterales bacterium]
MRVFLLSFIALFFISCGYQPSSKFARDVLGDKVSTDVIVSAKDPENSVVIKDSIDAAIVEKFHASLVKKGFSQTHLELKVGDPLYTPVQYDANGYVVSYRTTIVLYIKKYSNSEIKNYTSIGTYDFNIAPNAIISDQERFLAIKCSAQKALNSFLAQVSAEGMKED